MTPSKLEYAEKRMQQKWYDFVTAEQKGQPAQSLERLYSAYILAVEDYNRCLEEYQSSQPEHPLTVPVNAQRKESKPKRKAS